jgi:hypothetical protein
MVNDTVKYPIYRKYEGNRSFFKITSAKSFTEIQVMGNRYFKHEINAKTFPDFQLIVDMINLHNNHWLESNTEEFEIALEKHLVVAIQTV